MKRPHKYGAVATTVDGERFASKAEARRYSELRLLERAGVISDLKWQVPFKLSVGSGVVGRFIADFTYIRAGKFVCEDVKSPATITALFKWKIKHLLLEHGIAVEVVM